MKYNIKDIGGTVIKDNETYLLKDNTELKNLIISSTELKPKQSTRGHKHPGQEEVYIFVSGKGRMQLDDKEFPVESEDVITIHDGVFHRVYNDSESEKLYFVCVFDGKRNH